MLIIDAHKLKHCRNIQNVFLDPGWLRVSFSNINLTPAMSGSPNDANGRERGPMRFGRGACSARPVTSSGDPLDRIVICFTRPFFFSFLEFFRPEEFSLRIGREHPED